MLIFVWDEGLSAEKRYHFLQKQEIDCLFGPPSKWLLLIQYCEGKRLSLPKTLKYLFLGSAPVYSSFLKRLFRVAHEDFDAKILYGMTENLLISGVDAKEKMNCDDIEGDLVGFVFEGLQYRIGEDGSLYIRSAQLFKRYYHDPMNFKYEEHDTGDLASVVNGKLSLLGRKKSMIIRRNTNIYPELYESAISKLAGIEDVAMIGIYDESIQDERIYLVLCPSDKQLNKRDIYRQLQQGQLSIHRDARPEEILFMKIPRSGRQSKINRTLLKQKVENYLKNTARLANRWP